jgi:hypothetical protein
MQRFPPLLASILTVAAWCRWVLRPHEQRRRRDPGDYLLTLSGICMLLAGLAAGSTYSLVGISREMMTMLTLEPLFAMTIVIAAVHPSRSASTI